MAVVVDSTAVEADIGNCYSFSPCEIPRTGLGPSGFFMCRASARPVFLCAGPRPVRFFMRRASARPVFCAPGLGPSGFYAGIAFAQQLLADRSFVASGRIRKATHSFDKRTVDRMHS